ncbi:hypothetical protein D3C72_2321790 [compost metagenome]
MMPGNQRSASRCQILQAQAWKMSGFSKLFVRNSRLSGRESFCLPSRMEENL